MRYLRRYCITIRCSFNNLPLADGCNWRGYISWCCNLSLSPHCSALSEQKCLNSRH